MSYNTLVENLFFHPQHNGVLDVSQPFTLCTHQGVDNTAVFDLYLACNPQGKIERARFKAVGNPYLLASLEWICRETQDSWLKNHLLFDHKLLIKKLEIPRNRYAAALLAEKGYYEAIAKMNQLLEEKL